MRAVTGSISSTKPISLSKAAASLSKFASVENGARSDVAAYLKRAANAFEDLVELHREMRAARKKGGDGNPIPQEEERNDRGIERPNGVIGELEVERTKKKKGKENGGWKDDGDGNLTELGQNKSKDEEVVERGEEVERGDVERRNVGKVEMGEERYEERKKEKKRRSREEGDDRIILEEEGRDRGGKKRKHEEEEGSEVDDQRRHKRRKRRGGGLGTPVL